MWANICEKCHSYELRPSRVRNLFERLISFAVVPYRCRACDRRQRKFRGIAMGPPGDEELDDEAGEEVKNFKQAEN